MHTTQNIYIIEIDEEIKILTANCRRENIEEEHKIVYDDFNIIWDTSLDSELIEFMKAKLDEKFDGFSTLLEEVDLEELKTYIESLNDSFVNIKRCLKKDSILSSFLSDTWVSKEAQRPKPGVEMFIPTRSGLNPKNLQLRKPPTIWNLNSNGPNEVKPMDEGMGDLSGYDPCGSTYQNFENLVKEETLYIYFNKHFNKVIVLESELTNEIFPELHQVRKLTGPVGSYDELKEALASNYFFNIEQLEGFIKFYDNKKPEDITHSKIKKFINDYFTLSNDIKNKIKFTALFNKICNLMSLKDKDKKKQLKQLLPQVLKDIGLNKKRYSDGNYWYGIKEKSIKQPDNYALEELYQKEKMERKFGNPKKEKREMVIIDEDDKKDPLLENTELLKKIVKLLKETKDSDKTESFEILNESQK